MQIDKKNCINLIDYKYLGRIFLEVSTSTHLVI